MICRSNANKFLRLLCPRDILGVQGRCGFKQSSNFDMPGEPPGQPRRGGSVPGKPRHVSLSDRCPTSHLLVRDCGKPYVQAHVVSTPTSNLFANSFLRWASTTASKDSFSFHSLAIPLTFSNAKPTNSSEAEAKCTIHRRHVS